MTSPNLERATQFAEIEVEMHYGEACEWIDALEWYIEALGHDVPTWQDMHDMGWRPEGDEL